MLLYGILRPVGLAWDRICHHLDLTRKSGLKQVDLPVHGVLWVDESLDFVGDNCLRTNLLLKLVLDKAVAGAVYEISSDNLSAVETIPFMLPNCNCEHLATLHEPTCLKIYVRKCGTPTTGPQSFP
jgi:TusA-related sulfurtransferase